MWRLTARGVVVDRDADHVKIEFTQTPCNACTGLCFRFPSPDSLSVTGDYAVGTVVLVQSSAWLLLGAAMLVFGLPIVLVGISIPASSLGLTAGALISGCVVAAVVVRFANLDRFIQLSATTTDANAPER